MSFREKLHKRLLIMSEDMAIKNLESWIMETTKSDPLAEVDMAIEIDPSNFDLFYQASFFDSEDSSTCSVSCLS